MSIFSSQEEGKEEIGNVEIIVSDGWSYSGSVIPAENNFYNAITDAGEEVRLLALPSNKLQLQIGGEYIEEYQMQVHYES